MSGSALSGRHHSRPDIYAGSRRRVTGLGTIGAGFVALVLVLGALLTSELGDYGTSNDSSRDSPAPGAVPTPELTPGFNPSVPALPAPGGTPQASVSTSTAPTPAATDDTNRTVLTTINRSLAGLGCDKATYSPALRKAAQDHLTTMLRTGYLKLVSPDGDDPGKRARAAGYQRNVLEAIVLGAETPAQAATAGFPTAGDDAPPSTVRKESTGSLKCGYRAVGADMRLDSRNVPITVIFLGK